MADNRKDAEYSEKETERRMEDALRRALSTPHKPQEKFKGKSAATGKPKRKAKREKTKARKAKKKRVMNRRRAKAR